MTANNPLTTAPAVSTQIPSGIVPTGVTGVTAVPVAIIWDQSYDNGNGTTGAWRPLVGKDAVGMGAINFDSTGAELFTTGNPGQVAVSALPAGANNIGSVDLGSTGNLSQAATAGIGATTQVSVGTTATAIFNAAVTGKQIAINNTDSATTLYLGAIGVDTTTGFPVPAGQTFTMDIVSGSTIVIYGVASSALTAATMTVN